MKDRKEGRNRNVRTNGKRKRRKRKIEKRMD